MCRQKANNIKFYLKTDPDIYWIHFANFWEKRFPLKYWGLLGFRFHNFTGRGAGKGDFIGSFVYVIPIKRESKALFNDFKKFIY